MPHSLLAPLIPSQGDEEWPATDVVRLHGGERALVQLDAFPARMWHGYVKQVANVASPMDAGAGDVSVYPTHVTIDDATDGVRPDMSAQVTVFPDEPARQLLAVPSEALMHSPEQGRHCTCYVLTPEGPAGSAFSIAWESAFAWAALRLLK